MSVTSSTLFLLSTLGVSLLDIFFTVSQDTHDKDSLEAELTALLKLDGSEVLAAGVVSPVKLATDEDELEARLASLSIGAGQWEKGVRDLDLTDREPEGRDNKPQVSTKRSKQQPLPA